MEPSIPNKPCYKSSVTFALFSFADILKLLDLVKFHKIHDIMLIFYDFQFRLLFSMTFQAWKMVFLNSLSMTFHDQWSPW